MTRRSSKITNSTFIAPGGAGGAGGDGGEGGAGPGGPGGEGFGTPLYPDIARQFAEFFRTQTVSSRQ